jgi:hypothetical protein
MARGERLGEIIARRQLKTADGKRRVTVMIGRPRQIAEAGQTYRIFGIEDVIHKGDWICPFKITGLPEIKNLLKPCYNEIWGKDSLHALLNALRVIDTLLDKSQPPLHWKWSEGFDTGFPIIVEHWGVPNKRELMDKTAREVNKSQRKYANRPRPPWVEKMLRQINKA